MITVEAKFIKYLFVDIVAFTKNRSVEAQVEIIASLNQMVLNSIDTLGLKEVIYLPTGDGIAIAILDLEAAYDIHLQLALNVLNILEQYNQKTTHSARRFYIRIGINENVDNLVVDINSRKNLAGAGINHAQRVMDTADGKQIMVSTMVFDKLRHREKYMDNFKEFKARIKHGELISVYQYLGNEDFISTEIPSIFDVEEDHRLTLLEAYYIAHCIKNRAFLVQGSKGGRTQYKLNVLMWFLAKDSEAAENAMDYTKPNIKVIGKNKFSLDKMLAAYSQIDYWVIYELSQKITEEFKSISKCLKPAPAPTYMINKQGMAKLQDEYPDIWREFELG